MLNSANLVGDWNLDNSLEISTGGNSNAASTLGRFLNDDYQLLNPFGVVEGSAALWENLQPGLYKLNGKLASRDNENNDLGGFWDGRSLRTVAMSQLDMSPRLNSTVWRETETTDFYINVVWDQLGLTILDKDNSRGTSSATINSIERVSDLVFNPVETLALQQMRPDTEFGDIQFTWITADRPSQIRIGTATANRAISSIARELTGDFQAFNGYGTEGSFAQWELPNGEYQIEWQFYTSEDDTDRDAAYFWNGNSLELFAERAIATNQIASTRWESNWETSTVDVVDGKLTLLNLDTGDGADFSQLRIKSIRQLSELVEMPIMDMPIAPPSTAPTTHDPILGEPPWPYPEHPDVDMGNDWATAWDMGDESPWEVEQSNGSQWTFGYEYGTYHLGHFGIQEKIGGETVGGGWDSADRAKFQLTHDAYLNLYTDPNVITELVQFDAGGNPSVVASVEYGDRIQTFLTAGNYGLSFFVEGDAIDFNASGYLSQLDPNYAD